MAVHKLNKGFTWGHSLIPEFKDSKMILHILNNKLVLKINSSFLKPCLHFEIIK